MISKIGILLIFCASSSEAAAEYVVSESALSALVACSIINVIAAVGIILCSMVLVRKDIGLAPILDTVTGCCRTHSQSTTVSEEDITSIEDDADKRFQQPQTNVFTIVNEDRDLSEMTIDVAPSNTREPSIRSAHIAIDMDEVPIEETAQDDLVMKSDRYAQVPVDLRDADLEKIELRELDVTPEIHSEPLEFYLDDVLGPIPAVHSEVVEKHEDELLREEMQRLGKEPELDTLTFDVFPEVPINKLENIDGAPHDPSNQEEVFDQTAKIIEPGSYNVAGYHSEPIDEVDHIQESAISASAIYGVDPECTDHNTILVYQDDLEYEKFEAVVEETSEPLLFHDQTTTEFHQTGEAGQTTSEAVNSTSPQYDLIPDITEHNTILVYKEDLAQEKFEIEAQETSEAYQTTDERSHMSPLDRELEDEYYDCADEVDEVVVEVVERIPETSRIDPVDFQRLKEYWKSKEEGKAGDMEVEDSELKIESTRMIEEKQNDRLQREEEPTSLSDYPTEEIIEEVTETLGMTEELAYVPFVIGPTEIVEETKTADEITMDGLLDPRLQVVSNQRAADEFRLNESVTDASLLGLFTGKDSWADRNLVGKVLDSPISEFVAGRGIFDNPIGNDDWIKKIQPTSDDTVEFTNENPSESQKLSDALESGKDEVEAPGVPEVPVEPEVKWREPAYQATNYNRESSRVSNDLYLPPTPSARSSVTVVNPNYENSEMFEKRAEPREAIPQTAAKQRTSAGSSVVNDNYLDQEAWPANDRTSIVSLVVNSSYEARESISIEESIDNGAGHSRKSFASRFPQFFSKALHSMDGATPPAQDEDISMHHSNTVTNSVYTAGFSRQGSVSSSIISVVNSNYQSTDLPVDEQAPSTPNGEYLAEPPSPIARRVENTRRSTIEELGEIKEEDDEVEEMYTKIVKADEEIETSTEINKDWKEDVEPVTNVEADNCESLWELNKDSKEDVKAVTDVEIVPEEPAVDANDWMRGFSKTRDRAMTMNDTDYEGLDKTLFWLEMRVDLNDRDQYEIDAKELDLKETKMIGYGEFAMVFTGVLRRFGCKERPAKVAVKQLPPDPSMDCVRAFQDELDRMKRIGKHEHIVSLMATISSPTEPMIVMEFCHRGDLYRYLRTFTKHPTKWADPTIPSVSKLLEFAIDVARGMDYLASVKIIHRDLAARNVLLSGNNVVKVTDFGLSRFCEGSELVEHDRKLPARWLPLESIKDHKYSQASDSWSFAVLLFELFSLCETPYSAIFPNDLVSHLEKGNRLARPDRCPEAVYSLMTDCWWDDREFRPSFNQIVERLTEIDQSIADED